VTALRCDDVNVTYPDGRTAIDGVSFDIQAGESVALFGANGAGKSSLLMALVGVLPAEGAISVGGRDLSTRTLPAIRRAAQLLFQDPNDQILMPEVFDDVAFGPRCLGRSEDDMESLVRGSLEKVGIKGFETRHPHGLSFGEKKRVALAGALACEPEILLLDEPSAGLDPRGRRELAELLNSLEATKLIATHDIDFAARTCDRCLVLAHGRLVYVGNASDLIADGHLLAQFGLV